MGKYDKLISKNNIQTNISKEKYNIVSNNINEIDKDVNRTIEVYRSADVLLDDIDKRFAEATKLGKDDVAFLFFAVALQCIRQYVFTPFEKRLGDQEAAKNTKNHNEEHSNRKDGIWFYPSVDEIESNPVPFDTVRQVEEVKVLGALKGNGKMGHRLMLGHDPILGWIFGTSNIATSTLTTNHFLSFHVRTINKVDTLNSPANTLEMIYRAYDRFFNDGLKGATILAECLKKEWVHLNSDINTKNSLPLPFIATFSPEMANDFAKYGFDMANVLTVTKQATYATMINSIIGILHGMYCYYIKYPEHSDTKLQDAFANKHEKDVLTELELCKVRTRKILLLSNVIASTSNVLVVAGAEVASYYTANAALGEEALRYLDIGGYLVTLYRLISDTKFIAQIKKEFLEKEWTNLVMGEEYSFITEGENADE